jgi:hypothetical protein
MCVLFLFILSSIRLFISPSSFYCLMYVFKCSLMISKYTFVRDRWWARSIR